MVKVYGNPTKWYHDAIIEWFTNSIYSDAFLLFELKPPNPPQSQLAQSQIDLLVLRPNQKGIWSIEIKNKKFTKVLVNGLWEFEDRKTEQSVPLIQNDMNPYIQAEKQADNFKDWLIRQRLQLFSDDPILLEFLHQRNFKVFPCVLIREESAPREELFEQDNWIYLCTGCDELPMTLDRRWLPRYGTSPPLLKDQHIHHIVERLGLPEVEIPPLQESVHEESFAVMLQPVDTLEEFLIEARQGTVSDLLELIKVNMQVIADSGGLVYILDELGVPTLVEMIKIECSLNVTLKLLQEAYYNRWFNLTALLNQIGSNGLITMLKAEHYKSLNILLHALSRYRWAHMVFLQHTIFSQGLQEDRENSQRIFETLQHNRKVSLWAKKWISPEPILTALEKNPDISVYGLFEFLKTNIPSLYCTIIGKILRDGAQTFPFRLLFRCLDRLTPEDKEELQDFDLEWNVVELTRSLMVRETWWLSYFFTVSKHLSPTIYKLFLDLFDPTTLQQNILNGDKDQPYAWIEVINALHKAKWSKLGYLLDLLQIKFLWKPFMDTRIVILTAKLLNVLLSVEWSKKEMFMTKFAQTEWIDPTTEISLLSFDHLEVLIRHKFPNAIDLAKRIFMTVFVQTPYSWPINQYIDRFDKQGVIWRPWITPELVLQSEERGHYTRGILDELEGRGLSISENLQHYFSEIDTKEREIIFNRYPRSFQAKLRLDAGLLTEARELFAQAMYEFNINPTADTFRSLIEHSKKLCRDDRQHLFSTVDMDALVDACTDDVWLLDLIGEELAPYCGKTIIQFIMGFLNNFTTFHENSRVINHFVDSCSAEFIKEAISAKAFLVIAHLSKKEFTQQALLDHLAQPNVFPKLISDLDPSSPYWDSITHILDVFDTPLLERVLQNILESVFTNGKYILVRVLLSLSPNYVEIIIRHLLSYSDEMLSMFLNQFEFIELLAFLIELHEQKSSLTFVLLEKLRRIYNSSITKHQDKRENELLLAFLYPD